MHESTTQPCRGSVCVATETRPFSTARLTRGLVGAYNERPQVVLVVSVDSKVPPYSAERMGSTRRALAWVHCDQHEVPVQ